MPDGMSDYEWDFADGGTASTQQSEHTFNNTGEFPVVLQVTDASGRYTGRADDDGRRYDSSGRYLGREDDDGRHYDDSGRYTGRSDD